MPLLEWSSASVVLCAAALAGGAAGSGCRQPAVVVGEVVLEEQLFEFEASEVVMGSAKRMTVLTGFLLGGDHAELAALHVDENGGRALRLFTFEDGAWTANLEAALRSEVLFVDVARIGGTDRLISYEPGRLSWFDPESGSEQELLAVTSSFEPPRKREIPHVDLTRDVNGDHRDDLVVPDVEGFRVFVQLEGGGFADPVMVGALTDMSRILGADGYRFDPWSQSRVHEVDWDQDGRRDLVFWSGDHFEVHTQDEGGLFSPVAERFTTDVAFDSDELSSLISGGLVGRVLHSLADLNGDGVADLVVYSLEGTRISSKHSSYDVHFGAPAAGGGTAFAAEVGVAFESEHGVQLGMERHDFDRDGQVDLMLTSIDVEFLEGSLWKRLKGAMGDDVWLELEFFRSKDGVFSGEPDTTRRIALDGPPSHREPGWVALDLALEGGRHESRELRESYPRAFNTTLRLGDVTGDGRTDLLIGDHPRILKVFAGVPGPELFARRPQAVALPVPNDEEYTWLADLNGDGREDVLMHHPFTLRDAHGARRLPPGSEPHRVTLLLAR